MAKVKFNLASPIITQLRKDVRITFADSLSSFGEITFYVRVVLGSPRLLIIRQEIRCE